MPAKPLTSEQLADAARLKDIFTRAKERNPALTQAQLAYECGWGTQGTVSQYLLGKIPLNLDALLKFCTALHVPPEIISPTLADRLYRAYRSITNNELNEEAASYNLNGTSAQNHGKHSGGRKSRQKTAESSALEIKSLDLINALMRDSRSTAPLLEAMRVDPVVLQRFVHFKEGTHLALMTAFDDSMKDSFGDGDILLVDRSFSSATHDAVYVFTLENTLYVKRLQHLPDGSLLMISDNKKYEPYRISADKVGGFLVLGRVLLAWNARKI